MKKMKLCGVWKLTKEHTAKKWERAHLGDSKAHTISTLYNTPWVPPSLQFVYLFLHLYTASIQKGFEGDDTIVLITLASASILPKPRRLGGWHELEMDWGRKLILSPQPILLARTTKGGNLQQNL